MDPKRKKYYSVTELAEKLGLSRVAVFKKIQKGQLPAEKIGRAYAIPVEHADKLLKGERIDVLTDAKKADIEKAVKKVVKEYGETLRLLGKE